MLLWIFIHVNIQIWELMHEMQLFIQVFVESEWLFGITHHMTWKKPSYLVLKEK